MQKKQSQMRYDKEQIDQWLTEWEQSGQSISKYCDGKPFDKSTFYNWRSKERKPSVINEHKSKFVSVQVSPSFIPQMSIHYPNGVRVDMHMMLNCQDAGLGPGRICGVQQATGGGLL